MKTEILLKVLPSIFVAIMGSIGIFKLTYSISLAENVYDSAPEYMELDMSIGTYDLPKRIRLLGVGALVLLVTLILSNISAWKAIQEIVATASELESFGVHMLGGSLLIQSGVFGSATIPLYKNTYGRRSDIYAIFPPAMAFVGMAILLYCYLL